MRSDVITRCSLERFASRTAHCPDAGVLRTTRQFGHQAKGVCLARLRFSGFCVRSATVQIRRGGQLSIGARFMLHCGCRANFMNECVAAWRSQIDLLGQCIDCYAVAIKGIANLLMRLKTATFQRFQCLTRDGKAHRLHPIHAKKSRCFRFCLEKLPSIQKSERHKTPVRDRWNSSPLF